MVKKKSLFKCTFEDFLAEISVHMFEGNQFIITLSNHKSEVINDFLKLLDVGGLLGLTHEGKSARALSDTFRNFGGGDHQLLVLSAPVDFVLQSTFVFKIKLIFLPGFTKFNV